MTEQTQLQVRLAVRHAIVALLCASMVLSSFSFAFLAKAEDAPPPPPQETPAPPPADPAPAVETPPADPAPQPEPTPEQQTTEQTLSEPAPEETPTETPAPENQGDAEVTTGDALASAGSQNGANANVADVSSGNTTTTIENTNTADLTNSADAAATTGDNTATGGSASITTGDAVASANVINVVNTNIINSPGILAFFNMLFGGGFDMRSFDLSYFFGGGESSGATTQSNCSLLSCANNDGTLLVSNTNDATVTNTVLVRSSTGGNNASSTGDGSASINTGDAYASANVFNLVNTNLINSNYLLVALNNFGDMFGDITLPGASFFETLMQGNGSSLPASTTISNTNTATVTNNASSSASTGDNTATGGTGGDATVTTGDAHSAASTYNQVNTNMVGGSTVFFLINIFGDWGGNVQGLPEGMSWTRTPTGIALTSDSGTFGEMNSNSGASNPVANSLATLGVTNTNTANVTNNVQAWALTGANQAESSGEGDAEVETGDAYASTNVVNMINTNIIGKNWIFAIFNIFGNWNGNLSFGKPDLWIGAVAETSNPTLPGAPVTYHFTVSNRGDADATNTTLSAEFLKPLLNFTEGVATDKGMKWNLGTIKKGETKEFTYTANAGVVPEGTSASADLTASVTSTENDNNALDNTEKLSVIIQSPRQFTGSAAMGQWTNDPKLIMTKKVSAPTTTIPSSVDYEVTIRNEGGPAYNVVLTDTLTDPKGGVVYKRSWNLNTIGTNEEISLTYSVEYKGNLPLGKYKNTAQLKGQKGNSASAYAVDMKRVSASATVELLPGGEVLGAQTAAPTAPAQCAEFITAYISPDGNNSSVQVRRLQYFLRDFQNEPITPNGIYNEETIEAVKRFQEKYAGDVLMPWGMSDPSGVVFYTTQQKINELYCQGMKKFPLSKTQQQQILAYKEQSSSLASAPASTTTKWSDAIEQFLSTETVSPAVLLPSPKVSTPIPGSTQTWIEKLSTNFGFFSIFSNLFALSPVHFSVPHAEAAGK